MTRVFAVIYALLCYALFNVTFALFAGFLAGGGPVKSIDDGPDGPLAHALLIDLGLIALFGIVHSAMAREGFKRQWTRLIPAAVERSTYVLQSSLLLLLLIWQWRPITAPVWNLSGTAAMAAYLAIIVGMLLVLLSTVLLDHWSFVGVRQAIDYLLRRPSRPAEFRTPLLYRVVRHPLQLGVIIMLFATPHMSAGHLVLAFAMTGYVLIGVQFEERALLREFGARYQSYRGKVPMLLPWPRLRLRQSKEGT